MEENTINCRANRNKQEKSRSLVINDGRGTEMESFKHLFRRLFFIFALNVEGISLRVLSGKETETDETSSLKMAIVAQS